MKKTMTMTLTSKRQTVFPLEWCEREGLARGGPLNVFDLGKDGLLIRPVKAPAKRAIAKLLKQTPAGRHSAIEMGGAVVDGGGAHDIDVIVSTLNGGGG